jgi:hypothetical protein
LVRDIAALELGVVDSAGRAAVTALGARMECLHRAKVLATRVHVLGILAERGEHVYPDEVRPRSKPEAPNPKSLIISPYIRHAQNQF